MPVQTPPVAAGPLPPGVSTDLPGKGVIPFVKAAAPPRTQISTQTPATALSANAQPVSVVMPGTGYMLWTDLNVVVAPVGNTANVALAEDAPWSAISSITLDDGGPQLINCSGFDMYLQNLYAGGWSARAQTLSADPNVYQALSTGTATSAGTGSFTLRLPAAINERNYLGLLGNQDRSTKYNLRDDIAASSAIYTTPPSTLPTITINRIYGYLPVPSQVSADGRNQEMVPPWYGVMHFITKVRSDALPAANSVVNHYIRNLNNAVRLMILVFRSNGSRVTAESALPTQIDFVLGTDPIFSESAATRRRIMWNRYGFDAPPGVLVYDFLRDFSVLAGTELGDHYLYLGNISEAMFRVTYPSTWNNTNSSLDIITDSLFVPAGVSLPH